MTTPIYNTTSDYGALLGAGKTSAANTAFDGSGSPVSIFRAEQDVPGPLLIHAHALGTSGANMITIIIASAKGIAPRHTFEVPAITVAAGTAPWQGEIVINNGLRAGDEVKAAQYADAAGDSYIVSVFGRRPANFNGQ